jgi:ABC-type bacteriocin/lantibiotic exporter with double-glycine peptidase domain
MVLAYWGREHSEEELAQAFGTVPVWGTRPDRVVFGLEKLGYHALWFENATLERLLDLLAEGWPVIVFVRATDLPYGRAGLHAVVVIGVESERVTYLDPRLDREFSLELSSFLKAWSSLERQGLVVWLEDHLRLDRESEGL